MKLIIDQREFSLINKINELLANFQFKNIDVEVANLHIGDILVKNEDTTFLIIERKTINDYCASIKDGRNREQKKRLLSKFTKNQIIYLVEGSLDFVQSKYNRVNSDTVVSSILNTMMRDGIHVFHTKDSKEIWGEKTLRHCELWD